jgi:hypothetical protein
MPLPAARSICGNDDGITCVLCILSGFADKAVVSRFGWPPYGQPKYLKQIGQLIEAGPGGEYRLSLNIIRSYKKNIIRSYKKNIIRSYKKTECFPRIFANCWETRRALTDRRLARFMHERFSSGPNARK